MDEARSKANLAEIKDQEVKRIKAKPDYKQMHVDRVLFGQPQGLQPRIYAPIYDIKARLVS